MFFGDRFDGIQSGYLQVPISTLFAQQPSDDAGLDLIRSEILSSSALSSSPSDGSSTFQSDIGIRPVSDLDATIQKILVDQQDNFRFGSNSSTSVGMERVGPRPQVVADQSEVNFIAGVNPASVVVSPAYGTWDSVAHSNNYAGPSRVAKWGAGDAGTTGGTVTYFFDAASAWTATEQAVFVAAYALWSDVANIQFAAAASQGVANIVITRGAGGSGAFFQGGSSGTAGAGTIGGTNIWHFNSTGAFINLATADSSFGPVSSTAPDTAGGHVWGTIVHEEGHSIGLGHSGAYNGGVTPSTDQFSAQDNTQYSIMSYIDPTNATAKFFAPTTTAWGTSPDLFARSPTTFMMLDILAAQQLYGAPVTTAYNGGQIYGFNCNIADASKPFYDFTVNANPVVTIWSAGTNNTLDLSGFATASTVDLGPGTFSSCNGLVNNIGIAFNTAINKFVGGTGADTVTGNDNGDLMDGSLGGNDSFAGGTGNDGFYFGAAFTTADFVSGGAGSNDQIALKGDYAATPITISGTQLQSVEILVMQSGFNYDVTLTDSAATGSFFAVYATGVAAANTVSINSSAETATDYFFYMGQGNDTVVAGAGNDVIYGEGGKDTLTGGAGANIFAYTSASESTSVGFDVVTDFNYAKDKFKLPVLIGGVGYLGPAQALSTATFDADIAAAVNGHLFAGSAVRFLAGMGDYVDDYFLVVDGNGVMGYQAGSDFVFDIVGGTVVGPVNFIQ